MHGQANIKSVTLFAVATNSENIYLFAAWNASTQHLNVQISNRIIASNGFLFLLDGLPAHPKPPAALRAGGLLLSLASYLPHLRNWSACP